MKDRLVTIAVSEFTREVANVLASRLKRKQKDTIYLALEALIEKSELDKSEILEKASIEVNTNGFAKPEETK